VPAIPSDSRVLAGIFGPLRGADRGRVAEAVGQPGAVIEDRMLAAARDGSTGPRHGSGGADAAACLLAGTLYCRPELARELGVGPSLDAESLLSLAYRRWGTQMLTRLRGDFTLLVWDPRTGAGLLARDQLGTGSVFYSEASGRLSFATEVVELLRILPRRPGPDDSGVLHWLTLNASRPDLTLYEGTCKLPPGWCIRLNRDGGWRSERYWAPQPRAVRFRTSEEAAAAVRPILEEAVRRRLDPSGRTGVLLSGGLDSSGVAGLANRLRSGAMAGYSEVFPDLPSVDESGRIDRLSTAIGLPSTRLEVGAQGLIREIAVTIENWAVPPVGHNFWARPLRERAASEGVAVLLTGDGGDEVFGTATAAVADRLRSGRLLEAVGLARSQPLAIAYPPWRPVLRFLLEAGALGAAPPFVDRLHSRVSRHRLAGPAWLAAQATRLLVDSAGPPGAWKRAGPGRASAEMVDRLFSRVPAIGMFDYLRRAGRSTGTELRTPLFDLDLIQAYLGVDPSLSFGTLPKPVLRAALAGFVPDEIRLWPLKARFDDLLIQGVRGPDRPHMERLLTDPRAEVRRYLRPGAVRELLDGTSDSGMEAWRSAQALWRLLGLECWLRAQEDPTCLDRLQVAAPPRRFRLTPPPAGSTLSGR
jgi:asparagine synthase (glutamine-hydrolysing)